MSLVLDIKYQHYGVLSLVAQVQPPVPYMDPENDTYRPDPKSPR